MYKIFSIFTGAGGLDIGFHGDFSFLEKKYKRLKFSTIKAIEYNKEACASLEFNKKYFKDTEVVHQDITTLDPKQFLKSKIGEIDIILGGFPCVAFSMSGNRLGINDNIAGKLYETYAKYVETIKPKFFLAENVKGILSANKGKAIKIIVKRFEETGYKVKYKLINFAEYGVPQNRERVIFIGVRKDIKGDFEFPEPITKEQPVTSQEAFEGIQENAFNNELPKQREKTTLMLTAIPEGGNFKDLPQELSIKATQSNIYRKLDRNKPAYTLLASGGGGTWTYHFEKPRALTNRERARLQSFPDDYHFQGSNTEVRRQIGNAVPAVGIYYIAKEIQRLLDENN